MTKIIQSLSHRGCRIIIIAALFLSAFGFSPITVLATSMQLPQGMNATERESTLRLIGPTTSNKVLSDPYSLGGYAGFEVGIQHEVIPAPDIKKYGQRSRDTNDSLIYQKLTVGKGIYNDIDLYLSFTPWSRIAGITEYGAMVRWNFYQAKFVPAGLSLIGHVNVTNFRNMLLTENGGGMVIGSFNWRDVALYSGGGYIVSTGRFERELVSSDKTEQVTINQSNLVAGISYRWNKFLVAFEANRYSQVVYSGKLALRW